MERLDINLVKQMIFLNLLAILKKIVEGIHVEIEKRSVSTTQTFS
jgi:hypothetical protein